MDSRIVGEIALRYVLPVSRVDGEADGDIVDYLEKAGRAAAVLDVRLPRCVDRRDEDAHLRRDESGEVRRDPYLPRTSLLHARVCRTRPLPGLHQLYARCKR